MYQIRRLRDDRVGIDSPAKPIRVASEPSCNHTRTLGLVLSASTLVPPQSGRKSFVRSTRPALTSLGLHFCEMNSSTSAWLEASEYESPEARSVSKFWRLVWKFWQYLPGNICLPSRGHLLCVPRPYRRRTAMRPLCLLRLVRRRRGPARAPGYVVRLAIVSPIAWVELPAMVAPEGPVPDVFGDAGEQV